MQLVDLHSQQQLNLSRPNSPLLRVPTQWYTISTSARTATPGCGGGTGSGGSTSWTLWQPMVGQSARRGTLRGAARDACEERAVWNKLRRTTCSERPAQNDLLRTTCSERPAQNDRLRTTGSERPAQNDRLRTTGSERPAQNDWLRTTCSKRPAQNDPHKTTGSSTTCSYLCLCNTLTPLSLPLRCDHSPAGDGTGGDLDLHVGPLQSDGR